MFFSIDSNRDSERSGTRWKHETFPWRIEREKITLFPNIFKNV